jgi:hypothetical protein
VIFVLDLRSRSVGGGVTAGVLSMWNGPEGERALDRLRLARRTVFLAHGYNVHRRAGRERLTNLASFLGDGDDTALVAILWPGDSIVPVLSYPLEGKTADDSAKALARFIVQRNALRPGTEISVVTHSLGARVGMETLQRLLGTRFRLSQVCLMAPAIVDYSLSRPRVYRSTTEACERVAVLSSERDRVLRFAFPVGNLLAVFPLLQHDSVGLALGYHGPRSEKSSDRPAPRQIYAESIPPTTGAHHGDYLPDFRRDAPPENPSAAQRRRASAASFAAAILRGDPTPHYG